MSSYANFLAWFYKPGLDTRTRKSRETKSGTPGQPNAITVPCSGPARNAPPDLPVKSIKSVIVITMQDLDQRRLKRVVTAPRKTHFSPRHPVLLELLDRAYHKSMRRQLCLAVREYFENDDNFSNRDKDLICIQV